MKRILIFLNRKLSLIFTLSLESLDETHDARKFGKCPSKIVVHTVCRKENIKIKYHIFTSTHYFHYGCWEFDVNVFALGWLLILILRSAQIPLKFQIFSTKTRSIRKSSHLLCFFFTNRFKTGHMTFSAHYTLSTENITFLHQLATFTMHAGVESNLLNWSIHN